MTDQTPAQELRAAADRLRYLLHPDGMPDPIRRPWSTQPFPERQDVVTAPGLLQPVLQAFWGGVPEYVATMHPGVGEALLKLLERAARTYDASVEAASRVFPGDLAAQEAWLAEHANQEALAVARAILGSPQ